mmetsp:Transcript_102736/g.204003  ORF Transcript_102736/g.204003 Transcript_102736/m.204003 type:complete len:232 (-) Transcript_102736:926-1621(-)
MNKFFRCDLAVAVVHKFPEILQVIWINFKSTQKVLQSWVLDNMLKLILGQCAVSRCVQLSEETVKSLTIFPLLVIFHFDHEFVVFLCLLQCILDEHSGNHVEDHIGKEAAITDEKYAEPLADILCQHPASRGPVGKDDLAHCYKRSCERPKEFENSLPSFDVYVSILKKALQYDVDDHATNAVQANEHDGGPKERCETGKQAPAKHSHSLLEVRVFQHSQSAEKLDQAEHP